MSTCVLGGLRGLAMPPNLSLGPLTCLEVWWQVQTPGTRLRSVTPVTAGAAAGAWRGKQPRRADTEGILWWVWPGPCSVMLPWADLSQPGVKVHRSKPVVRFWCCVNIPEHPEGDEIMNFLHGVGTCDIGCVVIFHIFLR